MDIKRNIQQVGERFVVSVMKQGIRQRVTCATLEDAIAARARIELTTAEAKADQWTIGHTLKVVNEQVWSRGRNPNADRNGKYAVEYFGKDTLLDSITTVQIDAYTLHLRAGGNKDSTINRKLAALTKLMTYARQRNKMREKPVVPRQKENAKTNGRMCFVSQTEEAQVLERLARRGHDCQAEATIVLVDTGLRGSELWGMVATDVNLEQGTLTVWKSKNDEPRVIPMTARVKAIISTRMEHFPKGSLFPKSNNHWFRNAWDQVRAEMGRTDDKAFIPYALRHTFGSRLVQRGAPLEDIQYLMGHANITMTQRYTRHDPAGVRDTMKLLER